MAGANIDVDYQEATYVQRPIGSEYTEREDSEDFGEIIQEVAVDPETGAMRSSGITFMRFTGGVLAAALVFATFAAFYSWGTVVILGRIRGMDDFLAFDITYTVLFAAMFIIAILLDWLWIKYKEKGMRYGVHGRRTQWAARIYAFWAFAIFLVYIWVIYGDNGNTNPKNYNFRERVDYRVFATVLGSQLPLAMSLGIYAINSFLMPVHQPML